MTNAIYYWINLVNVLWNNISSNAILCAGIITVIITFVIKYLDQIKKIFK